MGYSRRKRGLGGRRKGGGGGGCVKDILFETLPGFFRFFTLPLEIPNKTKLQS